ncbi:hypothetical protein [Micrococcus luteus]|uniref:hypothetical protein n=1 Tax=Micrococcus luteus TaxID=1270 RepID=UPI0036AAA544
MSAAATLTRPTVGDNGPLDVRAVQRMIRAMSKRDAVTFLHRHIGVTTSWAERHLKALGNMHPHEFAQALALGGAPAHVLHGFDPTGNTAARNVDVQRARGAAR